MFDPGLREVKGDAVHVNPVMLNSGDDRQRLSTHLLIVG